MLQQIDSDKMRFEAVPFDLHELLQVREPNPSLASSFTRCLCIPAFICQLRQLLLCCPRLATICRTPIHFLLFFCLWLSSPVGTSFTRCTRRMRARRRRCNRVRSLCARKAKVRSLAFPLIQAWIPVLIQVGGCCCGAPLQG